jgi:hypothetical protein
MSLAEIEEMALDDATESLAEAREAVSIVLTVRIVP